jgi:3'-phosphoadenosine 5'-phosphosulfate (PAPS) 3'-phosphatase
VDRLIKTIEAELGETEMLSMGSSLKICLLAEARAGSNTPRNFLNSD